MKQDVGFFDVGTACPDLVIEDGDLKADNGLETASLISLFSDRRVSFEELPAGETDRMGWWADLVSEPEDDLIGSRLWLLERFGKIISSTPVQMEAMLKEAFDWMLEDGIAQVVNVSAERNGQNEVKGSVEIFRPDDKNSTFQFIWNGQELKLTEG
jgi:phage gp46-like protein